MIDKRLMQEMKTYKRLFMTLVGLSLGSGILVVLQADTLTKIIDGVFLGGLDLNSVWHWLSLLLGIMLLRSILIWLNETCAHRLAVTIKTSLRERLAKQLLALGPVHMSAEQAGELINLLVEGIENIEPYFARFLPQLFIAAVVPLLILGVVAPLDMMTALLLLITAPLIPVFMILIGKMAEKLNKRQWETLSRLSTHFLDVLQGLTTLKIFGRSLEQARVIARMSDEFRDITLSVLKVAFISALALELVATISTALVAVTVGLRLLYFKLSFSQAFFLLLLAPEFYLPLRQLGTHFHAGMAGTAAAERIYQLLAKPVRENANRSLQLDRQQAIAVHFKQVTYGYQNGERPALNGLDLTLAPGEHVALVGASGAGKSTVANLLLGFVEPQSGEILINGQSLADLQLSSWLEHVAFVPQSAHLFYGTVADNIRLGQPHASQAAVEAAAREAGAHEFIIRLPEGYQTMVGEGGQGLSGGEKRRLAIARAFLKDAPMLILDEATAGLDAKNEYEIQLALERLMARRTVLIIAHRLTTVVEADRIVVMHQGKAAEWGRHEDLLAKQGHYYQLMTAFRGAP
ncbi:thiol reductant ABC exporter subunit CydD [Sporomusaceae bacterium FL31]|nr:thiol reductant ABC exporter subunit CydD [Sporomusaceae bacterium FL31]GCE34255.1 thiol reductant ABC exporter subunit CydD [Sporomusaceae bacterium]